MKTTVQIIRSLALGVFLLTMANNLQAQPEGQMERFKEERIAYFNDKLDLTEEQAELFWPVQEDLHNRNMKINEDERSLLTYYNNNAEAMTDEEVDETIAKFMELQKKRVELSMQYHNTFVEIIGKRKTMKMYSLDRAFRMHVLRKFRAGGGEGGGGRGPHRGNR